jgi:molybdopterin-containing oxidoreductase family iron-sulfur binding subunit
MLCQHCHFAPCEPVCPVYAAYHNPEGLNVQVYQRCVGTRYCSNNCPYKVRRFNFWQHERPAPLNLMVNPDLVARDKGMMEKCTFCIQRIRSARDTAQDEGRLIRDGEFTTACAQSCPADAITFGDLNDKDSRVAKLAGDPRAYRVFEKLGTGSSIYYLAPRTTTEGIHG